MAISAASVGAMSGPTMASAASCTMRALRAGLAVPATADFGLGHRDHAAAAARAENAGRGVGVEKARASGMISAPWSSTICSAISSMWAEPNR